MRCFYCLRTYFLPMKCVCKDNGDSGMMLADPSYWQVFKAMLRVLDVRDRGLQNSMDKEWR